MWRAAIVVAVLVAGSVSAVEPVRRFGDERFRVTGWPIGSALSADGTRLAVLSSVGNHKVVLLVLDTISGRPACRAAVESHGHFAPPGLAFSPDGKYVAASVSPDVHVVWAADTGKLVARLPVTKNSYPLCQFTPDGRLAVTGETATDLFEVPSGKLVATWPTGRITRLTADAKTFARIEFPNRAVSLGDARTGAVAGTLPVTMSSDAWGNGLAFSRDGAKLAVVPDRTKLQVWDVATRRKEAEVDIPAEAVHSSDPHYFVRYAPDGRTLTLETNRGAIYRWDAKSLTPLRRLEVPGYVHGVHWSTDGRTMLAVANTGLVHRWDATTDKPLPAESYVRRVYFDLTTDGSRLVVGDHAGRIDVYDLATGRPTPLRSPGWWTATQLTCLAVSPDGTRLAVGHRADGVRLLRLADGRDTTLIPPDPATWFHYLAWAPDGSAAFASDFQTVYRLAVPSGRPDWAFPGLGRVTVSPDGRAVVHVSGTGVTVLDAATGRAVRSFTVAPPKYDNGISGPVRPVVSAPDGGRLAAALGDTVAIFDHAGRELRRFVATDPAPPPDFNAQRMGEPQLPHFVEALSYSPDGKWLVSGGRDLAVKVWEAATGKLVMRFDGSDSKVEQVAVSPDGRSAFAAGSDGFVAQWDLTPRPVTGKTPDELWATAANADPAVAVPAAWALVGGAKEFLARTLPPAEAGVGSEQIDKWIADLGAAGFATREAATRALADRGRLAAPPLRAAKESPNAEVKRRAEELLARLDGTYTADELRGLRIVQACERAGNRELLTRWAGGAPGAVLTEDARGALERIHRRMGG